jgi:hypothetical protein
MRDSMIMQALQSKQRLLRDPLHERSWWRHVPLLHEIGHIWAQNVRHIALVNTVGSMNLEGVEEVEQVS